VRAAEQLDPDPQDLALMRGYPRIPWLTAIYVHVNRQRAVGCRLCIARDGLQPADVASMPQTEEELREHLRAFHHLDPP
jgi:hypothetical protein